MKTQEQYVKAGGRQCPKCGSLELESQTLEADGPLVWCTVECNGCDYEYTDQYTLAGYTPGENP